MNRNMVMAAGRAGRRGFTLVEILVVVAIIGMLAAIILGISREVLTKFYTQRTLMMMQTLHTKLDAYATLHPDSSGNPGYPLGQNVTTTGDQAPLVNAINTLDNTNVAALAGKSMMNPAGTQVWDAWQQPIRYYHTTAAGSINSVYNGYYLQMNRMPLIISAGPDTVFLTGDDLLIPTPPGKD